MEENTIIAEVIAVLPNKVKISVTNIEEFKIAEERLAVGSYLRVSDSDDCAIIAMVDNFLIDINNDNKRKYIIEAVPLGFIDEDNIFHRGGNNIAIPPTGVKPARKLDIQNVYDQIEEKQKFCFSKLAQNQEIFVPVNGDKLFNKHIAIVGSTGSGKSHSLAKIIQEATIIKNNQYEGLNNSHIIIFDIHGEYKSAFPDANLIDINNLKLPYWLMNGEELEELFVETGDNQAYNQTALLRRIITKNKQKLNNDESFFFDSPVKFSIKQVLNCIINLSKETRNAKKPTEIKLNEGAKDFSIDEDKFEFYFVKEYEFEENKAQSVNKGTYNDGTLEKFISRIKNKIFDKRLSFLLADDVIELSFEDVLSQLIGYSTVPDNCRNITVIDLSGVPFEVLSITVSLISRIIFEYGYYYKKLKENNLAETPILIVYEEAHRYVPKIKNARYNASRVSIERIAKEGRKYGVTLVILSQRPSEISETIFSQCNNFIVMRLTNPEDQNYVKRLLPDSLGPLTDSLCILEAGEALIIGDSIIMPSLVKIDQCNPEPASNDIKYLEEWKKPWVNVLFSNIKEIWT